MSTESLSIEAADETIRRMRAAVEGGDVDAFLALTAPDAVLRSPITDAFEFRGRDELRELMTAVFAAIEDIRYYEELGDERTRSLFYRARVGAQRLEEATLVRLDDQARITEFTIWFRPLPGLTRVAAGLAPRLARGRAGSVVVGAGTRMLAFLSSKGEGALLRFVRPR